jgi:hypothetical protein
MRNLLAVGIILTAGFVTAQTTVTPSWFASNRYDWSTAVPLVNTPVVQLGTPAMEAGASNATAGNAAGATANTPWNLGVTTSSSIVPYAWAAPMMVGEPQRGTAASDNSAGRSASLDLGAAEFDSAYDFPTLGQQSLAQVAAATRKRVEQHANKTYTNEDISRFKEQAGGQPTNSSAPASTPQQNNNPH